ncbi:phosphate ABC transporter membrane protein 2, PhoT family [Desulfuromonas soudanensis]|uniref:Phosphate transport system permease protein PstA n=1 Tax=Desulfuromonas soudanensis TaxID=1603606 RepID=A0A0M5IYB1_9BACT|nr:phosphate ABC transporter permease PstA [Desulfuromonas soudanensis]ALC14868.1 phosphate ABC transporter membrane protein 2, PhoT family [Desulfuromonas soudanensis]
MSRKFWREGEPLVWGTAAALTLTLLIAATLVIVVLVNGLGVFWPSPVASATLADGSRVMGEIVGREPIPEDSGERLQFKIGNRDLYGLDFRWIDASAIVSLDHPRDALVLERQENGNFYGTLLDASGPTAAVSDGDPATRLATLRKITERRQAEIEEVGDELSDLNSRIVDLTTQRRDRIHRGERPDAPALQELEAQAAALRAVYEEDLARQEEMYADLQGYTATVADASGVEKVIPLSTIVRAYRPNAMTGLEKVLFYLSKLKELLLGEPRESNTEGGLFPAIFGTVMLIFLMSLVTFPLGVMAAVYLREYAREGMVVRLVRIAVNNLAGIPSIVYGIFGLAFFIYGIGASIDQMFFPERLPAPTFGTGGILWASLTLALLTVPVVIVATEEALGAIPAGVREGSLALGATKFQTLTRTLLPMASPGIMTGLILAMARAAGEVAPLMITGVVKLAPALPLDGQFPFLHLDRKFMHLGFHIYDIAFQSPNAEAARPMVFVTTLLLVLIVLGMSSVAIVLRNRMKKRYTYGTF